MQKKIEHLLPAALNAVNQVLVKEYGKNKIPKGYQGAISGFGTSLIQMGLLPTLAVYSDKDSSASIKRPLLLEALFSILTSDACKFSAKVELPEISFEKNQLKNADGVLEEIASSNYSRELKEHLMHAALALKLAIRTYKLVD